MFVVLQGLKTALYVVGGYSASDSISIVDPTTTTKVVIQGLRSPLYILGGYGNIGLPSATPPGPGDKVVIQGLNSRLYVLQGYGSVGAPIAGIGTLTFTPYIQNRFAPAYYTYANNKDLLLDESTGMVYEIAENISNDNGKFIYMNIRTTSEDGGTNETKFCPVLELIGDKVNDRAYVSYSDDDYQTFGWFRKIDLNAKRSQLRRNGSFRRRAHSITYLGAFPLRLSALELNVTPGM